jgi:hypothetical protein
VNNELPVFNSDYHNGTEIRCLSCTFPLIIRNKTVSPIIIEPVLLQDLREPVARVLAKDFGAAVPAGPAGNTGGAVDRYVHDTRGNSCFPTIKRRAEVPGGTSIIPYITRTSGNSRSSVSRELSRGAEHFIVFPCNFGTGEVRLDKKEKITMPPLRPYEMPDVPAVALDLEPEPSEYEIPAESLTRDELRECAQPVEMTPLRDDELPDTVVSVIRAEPDALLDDPSWGIGKPAPDIVIRKGRLLHPWDDEPEDDT